MSDFVFTLMTNDPVLASAADAAGVERIGIDLEVMGKDQRQSAAKHWISDHTIEDLHPITAQLKRASLFARINPLHDGSSEECEALLRRGVKVIMLPYFKTPNEVRQFAELIGGRAKTVLLVETPEALDQLEDMVSIPSIDEIHFGLNDLSLGLGLSNHFEVLRRGLLDRAVALLKNRGCPFGIAGIARPGQTGLPLEPQLIYAQLVRLGATRALISRSFFLPEPQAVELGAEIAKARRILKELAHMTPSALDGLFETFCDRIAATGAVRQPISDQAV